MYRLLVAQINPYNGTAMATGSGREMVRRAAFSPRRGGGGVSWGWSPAAGGALTAVRLERLGAVAVASERRVWRAMVFVRRRRRWSSESCGRSWSRPVLGWSLRRRRGCEVLFRGAGRRSGPVWFRCLRPAGCLLGYRGCGRWSADTVFGDTALHSTRLGPQLSVWDTTDTILVGVISSYLRVLIGPKVMTISLSVVDWLRPR